MGTARKKQTREKQEVGAGPAPAELDKVFFALSDPTRREIVRRLAGGPTIVTELAKPFAMSLPAISRHLRVLQDSGLVVQDKKGRERRCLLNPKPLQEITDWSMECRDFWSRQFQSLEKFLSKLDENGEQTSTEVTETKKE